MGRRMAATSAESRSAALESKPSAGDAVLCISLAFDAANGITGGTELATARSAFG